MAKAFFRFLRGELNGFYVQNINQVCNEYTSDIKNFFVSFSKMQFEKGKIDEKYLYELGTFAGILLPRLSREENLTALKLSESYKVENTEVSESGLFDLSHERFEFFPEAQGDINNLATNRMRSSLVDERAPLGYISSEETNLFDDDLNVRPTKILPTPPEGTAYSDFYGNQFMFLSENTISYEKINSDLYIDLFKAVQWIRHNGVSVISLLNLINLICPYGLIKLVQIQVSGDGSHIDISYIYNDNIDLDWKLQRKYLFEYIVDLKMPQIKLTEQI